MIITTMNDIPGKKSRSLWRGARPHSALAQHGLADGSGSESMFGGELKGMTKALVE